jgi:hypothetical protein
MVAREARRRAWEEVEMMKTRWKSSRADEEGDVLAPVSSFPSNLPLKMDLHLYIHIWHITIKIHFLHKLQKMAHPDFTNLGPTFWIISKTTP